VFRIVDDVDECRWWEMEVAIETGIGPQVEMGPKGEPGVAEVSMAVFNDLLHRVDTLEYGVRRDRGGYPADVRTYSQNDLQRLAGFTEVLADLTIWPGVGASLEGLECIQTIAGDLIIEETVLLESLDGLKNLTGSLKPSGEVNPALRAG